MATEEDNFDIDVYGEDGGEYNTEDIKQEDHEDFEYKDESYPEPLENGKVEDFENGAPHAEDPSNEDWLVGDDYTNGAENATNEPPAPMQDEKTPSESQPQSQPQQGKKRKSMSAEDLPVDPGATTALLVSDLHWWTTEDEIRGWANTALVEPMLSDVTFSEHKVNGKSKGQAFLLFTAPQAATATKHYIESLSSAPVRKYTTTYTNPLSNPFKTLPKDAPARAGAAKHDNSSAPRSASVGSYGSGYNDTGGRGGYRGRGGYGNRGGMGMGGGNSMGYNQNNNRNFSGGYGGGGMRGGGYQGGGMGNFGGGGFNNRGGMMGNNFGGGMRGGRGGGGMAGMGMNGMGGMNGMNGMGMMGMNGMMPMGMGMPGIQLPRFSRASSDLFQVLIPANDLKPCIEASAHTAIGIQLTALELVAAAFTVNSLICLVEEALPRLEMRLLFAACPV
ncbi:MAG: hypothetical protein Q9227_001664 [Pyrenula ochraceoflavens]